MLVLGLFFLSGYYKTKESNKFFIEMELHGIINEIKYNEGYRGLPHIKIDNQWIFIGINGEKVHNHIIIGDSIVKDSGTTTFKVYRKNEQGVWDERIYK